MNQNHLQLCFQLQKLLIQPSDQNAVISVVTLVLTFNRILSTQNCIDVFIVQILLSNRPQMYLFWPRNIDLKWKCPLKPRVSHGFCAFRSGTSAPFLGQISTFMGGRFGVPRGTMDSRGLSGDLFGAWGETMARLIITEITRNKNARQNYTALT